MLRRNHPIIENERAMMSGGMGLSGLMAPAAADRTAVQNGPWSEPATWGGTIPQTGEHVHIPPGLDVTYDMDDGRVLGWIRVDGILRWRPDIVTFLVCDTILGSTTSYIEIGNPVAPVTAYARIRFRDGALMGGDMMEMSRGLIALGRVMMRGASKVPFTRLAGSVGAGVNQVTVQDVSALADWRVGDWVSIPPTTGWVNSDGSTTVAPITAINGAVVTIGTPTTRDYPAMPDISTPRDGWVFERKPYILNLSRTIRFESENPNGTRAHMMIGHNHPPTRLVPRTDEPWRHKDYPYDLGANADPRVDVRWVEIWHLGRTRATSSPEVGQPGNREGRYAFHLHRVGHWTKDPVIVQGCTTFGSLLWAYVHHDSHAHFDQCIAESGTGGGFICEDDTETGAWTRCFAVDMRRGGGGGELRFNGHGRDGDGFVPNRQILMRGNRAANCHRGLRLEQSEVSPFTREPHENSPQITRVSPPGRWPDREGVRRTAQLASPLAFNKHEDPNLSIWRDHEFYSCNRAFRVFHRQRNYAYQPFWAQFREWNVWRCGRFLDVENYSYNYIFRDFAAEDGDIFTFIGDKVSGMVFVNGTIRNFNHRMDCFAAARNALGAFVDVTLSNVGNAVRNSANTGLNRAIYSSNGWTVPAFSAPSTPTPSGWFYRDTLSANGVPMYSERRDSGDFLGDDRSPTSPLRVGEYDEGRNLINAFQIGLESGNVREVVDVRGQSLTPVELVEQLGCFQSGGVDRVALDYVLTDRFNGEMHMMRYRYAVPNVPQWVRDQHRMPAEPPMPALDDLHLEPDWPDETPPVSYLVTADPATGALFVAQGGEVRLEADALFANLLAGQSTTIAKDVTVRDRGTGETGTARVSFDVQGRGQPPANTFAPRITRHGIEIDRNLHVPQDRFSETDKYSVRFELGGWTGFPEPTLAVRLIVNGQTVTNPAYFNEMHWIARRNRTESLRIGVTASNIHGSTSEVLSNTITFA